MTRVLFVCTGNVHRSALAERLLAARLAPGSAVWPESAGTGARHHSGMDAATRRVLEELGGDGAGFVSRPLTEDLVGGADLILGLAREHREAAVRISPLAMRRCFTLKEFVRLADGASADVVAEAAGRRGLVAAVPGLEDDVEDPWAQPIGVLRACAHEIDVIVTRLAGLLDPASTRTLSGVATGRPFDTVV
ncbi:arsenate reductase/protein-tyrosine-phosphatase family protein [Streptomyces himalayensis]|uniref:Low molecular weight phosphatase family protein n=1 Tax=Streptomyces himalayensis subsp. himalayensis TaxID=2756131 RepID=A0A7W0I7D8_9ACTN|nr:low molecular weight phosphatase family protein [Streptomyces himalayensis]MBA2945185.1 low molecular weight phosphatase family protein [Streptomyces himalayensis subsp. himalayensis]